MSLMLLNEFQKGTDATNVTTFFLFQVPVVV